MWAADRFVDALRFAAERHRGQLVPGTELPYLVHLVSVTNEVAATLAVEQYESPDLAVQCALLHDTLEDTETTLREIEAAFGRAVAAGVSALTKNDALPKEQRIADSLERIRQQPHEVWLVKLADRITNLAPAPAHWSSDKKRAYRDEALAIHAALASASPLLGARLLAKIEGYAL